MKQFENTDNKKGTHTQGYSSGNSRDYTKSEILAYWCSYFCPLSGIVSSRSCSGQTGKRSWENIYLCAWNHCEEPRKTTSKLISIVTPEMNSLFFHDDISLPYILVALYSNEWYVRIKWDLKTIKSPYMHQLYPGTLHDLWFRIDSSWMWKPEGANALL